MHIERKLATMQAMNMETKRLIIAKNIGFCFGVRRAVEIAETAQKEAAGIVYTYGDIIHNTSVVEHLRERGIHSIEDYTSLTQGDTLIVRSHGADPCVFSYCAERGIKVCDATCPFVERIHVIVRKAVQNNKKVVIVGHANHPEVIGIVGNCRESAYVISDIDGVAELPDMQSVVVVSQTTFMRETFDEIVTALRERFGEIEVFGTICDTTRKRQDEARELSKICDSMIVIGGRSSSNTQKLLEICRENCKYILYIENTYELSLEKEKLYGIIGIVAGASTPDWTIREVITNMNENETTVATTTEEVTETTAAPTAEKTVAASETTKKPTPAKGKVQKSRQSEESSEDFGEMLDEATSISIREGHIVTGTVLSITKDEVVWVKLNYKADGVIPKGEFSLDPDVVPSAVLQIGQEIKAEVVKKNDGTGSVLLSRKSIERKLKHDEMYEDEALVGKVFDAVVKDAVNGGVLVSIMDGLIAFVPAVRLTIGSVPEDLSVFVGKHIKVKITEVDKEKKRIRASARDILIDEIKTKACEDFTVGQKVKGTVKHFVDSGAFVEICEGFNAFLPNALASWTRGQKTSEIFELGQQIEVVVVSIDKEKRQITVNYKQLQPMPNPWDTITERYNVGDVVTCKVFRILEAGALVSLERGVSGKIPISQLAPRHIETVEDAVSVGDTIRCKIISIDLEASRMVLSRKAVILDEDPELAAEVAKEQEARAERRKAEQQRREADTQRRSERAARPERSQSQPQQQGETSERPQRQPRRDTTEARPMQDRGERRPRHNEGEGSDYELPPVEASTTSLASLLSGFNSDDDK